MLPLSRHNKRVMTSGTILICSRLIPQYTSRISCIWSKNDSWHVYICILIKPCQHTSSTSMHHRELSNSVTLNRTSKIRYHSNIRRKRKFSSLKEIHECVLSPYLLRSLYQIAFSRILQCGTFHLLQCNAKAMGRAYLRKGILQDNVKETTWTPASCLKWKPRILCVFNRINR